MRFKKAFLALIVVQVAAIVMLLLYVGHTQRFSLSVSPLSRSDISMATSSTHAYFYDLSHEQHTIIPDWLPYTVTYERNKDHLNDRFDYVKEKSVGVFRILTLGDSWTFGMHVSTQDNYSERLEDMLNEALQNNTLVCSKVTHFDVMNFGVGGYDIDYMVESLRSHGMEYHPDVVIPLIKYDDLVFVNELWTPRIQELQKEYVSLDQTLVDGKVKNPAQEIGQRVQDEMLRQYSESGLAAYEERALNSMQSFYAGKLLLFLYGNFRIGEDFFYSYTAQRAQTFVYKTTMLAADEKVPRDEHPGLSGHARFARELFTTLIEQHIIPCSYASKR